MNEENNNQQLNPIIEFKTPEQNQVQVVDAPRDDAATQLVESAFQQAVINKVKTDTDVQEKLLDGAKQVIDNKVEALKNQADTEAKTANYNNKKGACECFGYNESTTEKWAVNTMNAWHNVMTAIWIIIGSVTFAPITFIAKKIRVILKASWLAITISIIIYGLVTTSPIWIKYLQQIIK